MRIKREDTVLYKDGQIIVPNNKENNEVILDLVISSGNIQEEEDHIKLILRSTSENKYQLVVLFPSGVEQILATDVQ